MEESLLFPESQGLLLWADFTDVLDDSKNASVTFRMLIFPFGRCMVISPPPQENSGNFKPNRLTMGFNNTFLNQSKLRLFFMDNRNSPKFNPDDMENNLSFDWLRNVLLKPIVKRLGLKLPEFS
jgi:hypothetical protein